MSQLFPLFLDACLINNFILAYFLGICPFLGVTREVNTSARMGGAVIFVMLVSSVCAFGVNALLTGLGVEFLRLISFIVVIASTVQLVEMAIKKLSPALFRSLGIFLPLITTNCAILAVALFQTAREYRFLQCVTYALGAGVGFFLVLVLMASMRQHLDLSDTPKSVKGTVLALVVAGILSTAFMGFAGMGGGS
ncbi:MAG: RnfABCDGE type electron transport complex subunit A [Acidobacteria bacterium]|nr:RnfABCDGE type electron transport complex subunit A [Acidobacteriota bacterium]